MVSKKAKKVNKKLKIIAKLIDYLETRGHAEVLIDITKNAYNNHIHSTILISNFLGVRPLEKR